MNDRAVAVSKIQDWLCGRFAPKTKTVRNSQRWKDIHYALMRAYEAGQNDNTMHGDQAIWITECLKEYERCSLLLDWRALKKYADDWKKDKAEKEEATI